MSPIHINLHQHHHTSQCHYAATDISSFRIRRYRKSSRHKIQMFLIHPILVREQALHIVIRALLPPLIPLFLLCKDFCRQRCRVCVLDIAFWLPALSLLQSEGFFRDGCFCDSGRLLPFLTCTGGFLERMCQVLGFEGLNALFEAVLVFLGNGENRYDVLGGVGCVTLLLISTPVP